MAEILYMQSILCSADQILKAQRTAERHDQPVLGYDTIHNKFFACAWGAWPEKGAIVIDSTRKTERIERDFKTWQRGFKPDSNTKIAGGVGWILNNSCSDNNYQPKKLTDGELNYCILHEDRKTGLKKLEAEFRRRKNVLH